MKCPECVEEGERSTVFAPTGSIVTDMANNPYYDEDGRYHNHDPNSHTSGYSCSRGHHWVETDYDSCWCGWRGGPDG